ncbi:MAG: YicC/YloC family endoribonuclease [Flavobacteriaceae bacterium]
MILSMTGFGRAEAIFEGKKINVDIKSLNSKSFDLSIKLPLRFKEKELEIRKSLNDKLLRGKVDCFITYESLDGANDVKINQEIIKSYMEQLRQCSPEAPDFEYLKMAIRMPETIQCKTEELSDNEWNLLQDTINKAVIEFSNFRKTEGEILGEELTKNIKNIEELLGQVQPFEEERISTIKERYLSSLKDFEQLDETRFYQEVAYFVEKLDISEEKVRLTQHLKYFLEVLNNEDFNGKKLGFISQEIGREINTLGSKANHHEIQKIVVMMKDNLEKIKEQTLNVL